MTDISALLTFPKRDGGVFSRVANFHEWGNFKGGVSPVNGVSKWAVPLVAHAIWGFSDPTHAIWCVAETFLLL